MFSLGLFSSWSVALGLFLVSLIIVIGASTQFTRRLERLCEIFQLSIGMLSLLSALGANIPNYVSSALAIAAGQGDVGIGIIVGSNIYNIAIILGLCTFFVPERAGITLDRQEKRDVGVIARYAFVIMLLASAVIFCLPSEPLLLTLHIASADRILFPGAFIVTILVFGALLTHILRRSHGGVGTTLHHHEDVNARTIWSILRLIGEVIFTLVIALGGVLVMVQSGQTVTADLQMPSVLAGLLVLAVATSLPNTVVALSLVRTGETSACVEEVCSSGSINTVLGIVVPLICWQTALLDRYLLLLDLPLLLVLAAVTVFCVLSARLPRSLGVLLLGTYVAWVVIRFLL
jgi:cation:H+ antiporter